MPGPGWVSEWVDGWKGGLLNLLCCRVVFSARVLYWKLRERGGGGGARGGRGGQTMVQACYTSVATRYSFFRSLSQETVRQLKPPTPLRARSQGVLSGLFTTTCLPLNTTPCVSTSSAWLRRVGVAYLVGANINISWHTFNARSCLPASSAMISFVYF